MDLLKAAVRDKSVSGAQLLSAILSLEKAKLPVRLALMWHALNMHGNVPGHYASVLRSA